MVQFSLSLSLCPEIVGAKNAPNLEIKSLAKSLAAVAVGGNFSFPVNISPNRPTAAEMDRSN